MTRRFMLATALLPLVVGIAAASETGRATAGPQPQQLVAEIVALVEQHFFEPDRIGATWARAAAEAQDHATSSESEDSTSAIVNELLGKLNASHTAHYPATSLAYYHILDIFSHVPNVAELIDKKFGEGGVTYEGIGAFYRRIGDRWFADGVLDGSDAENAGLRNGDEIVHADGQPFHPIETFRGRSGQTVTLAVRSAPDQRPRGIALAVQRIRPKQQMLDALKASARLVRAGDRQIGYLRFWSYAGLEYQDALIELLGGKFQRADALLLDLRGKWGGANLTYITPYLPGPDMQLLPRGGDPIRAVVKWRRPVGLLVDEGSRSGNEIVAYAFQKYDIGPVFGGPTAGAVLGGRVFPLADDSVLYLAVTDATVDGQRLEGQPVIPDVEVPFELPYSNGADPRLERALSEMGRIDKRS